MHFAGRKQGRTRSRSSGERLAKTLSARREAARTPGCPSPRACSTSRVAASSSTQALAPSPVRSTASKVGTSCSGPQLNQRSTDQQDYHLSHLLPLSDRHQGHTLLDQDHRRPMQ